ncbi:MAG: prephenate dehydrogenase/arogenate dehydrogenase family protein [Acidimicrobiales bacterium]
MTTSPTDAPGTVRAGGPGRAMVIGTGLIGGSVGMALRSTGWYVTGSDATPGTATRAVELGALDEEGTDRGADLVVVATPVHVATGIISDILSSPGWNPAAVVTDVGGVKGPLVAAVDSPRFVGGHPMAGSEQVGVDGASAELFVGATWVLTPTPSTDPAAYAKVRSVLADFGANVIALDPGEHDTLVAVVSHVPHLTAATLMALASDLGEEHGALMQLAAGGFRDMTRIAAGQPAIWPGICDDNADAIVETLGLLIEALEAMRDRVADRDHGSLLGILQRAATARRAMSERVPRPEELVEVRIPVQDRPGTLAEILVLATELGINIDDFEIAHSVEGSWGVLILVIDAAAAPTFTGALAGKGYRSSTTPVGTVR